MRCGLSHAQVTGLYAGLAVVAAAAALAGLGGGEPLREVLIVVAYAPMLAVVALAWRLEHTRAKAGQAEKPNQASTVVTQGHS